MHTETIPQHVFLSRLPAGEQELFCYLCIHREKNERGPVKQVAWQVISKEDETASQSGVIAFPDNGQGLSRVAIAAILPSNWKNGQLNIDVQCTQSTWRKSLNITPFYQGNSYRLPLAGMVLVVGGHRIGEPHRTASSISSQHFAWDVLPLGRDGLRLLHTEYSDSLQARDFAGFGQDVLAPAEGRIIQAVDGHPDSVQIGDLPKISAFEGDPRRAFGNHVILDHGSGVWSFLAHLRQGSIRVEKGKRMEAGQAIGELGSSGYVSGPHLHFQFMDGPDPLTASPLPIELDIEGRRYAPQSGEIILGY